MSTNQLSYNISPNPDDDNLFSVPTGAINLWSTATAPIGWLLCNGVAYSRTLYAELFSVIGTLYGTGDASFGFQTTFVNGGNPSFCDFISATLAPISAFPIGGKFTVTGGPTNFNLYTFTVVSRTGGNTIGTTAVQTSTGAAIIFTGGTLNIAGTMISSAPTTFNVPNTGGVTVRGVGTSALTTVTLAQAAGGDSTSVTLNAGNLPPHRHGITLRTATVPGSSGGIGYAELQGASTTNAAATFLEDGTTLVSNTPFSVATTNQYLGLNYIIKT
jgi:microcystin-dependent protein